MAEKRRIAALASSIVVTAFLVGCTPITAPDPASTSPFEGRIGCSEGEIRKLMDTFIAAFNEADRAQLAAMLDPALDVYAVGIGNDYIVIRGKNEALEELRRSRAAGEVMRLIDLRISAPGAHVSSVGVEFGVEKNIRGRLLAFRGKGQILCDTYPPRILAWDMATAAP